MIPTRALRLSLLLPALLAAACSSTPSAPEPKGYPRLSGEEVGLKRLWKTSVGDGWAEEHVRLIPAVTERHVAAASRDGMLLLVDREDGDTVWRKKTGLAITAGPAAGYGMVVVGTAKGEVVAFAEADGRELWRSPLGAALMAVPAIAQEVVVVLAADGVVHALSRDKGETRWTYNTTVPPLSLHANATPLIADNRVYIATATGRLARLELASGIVDWELRVATNSGRSELERMTDIVASPLRVGEREIYTVGFQSQLTLTDVEAGRRRWQFDVSSVNDLAESLGNIYVSDTEGNVQAVDRASGKLAWKQPDYAYRRLSNPVVLGSYLAVGDDDGKVHILAQSDGAPQGRIGVSGDALAALIVRDGVLYAWDEDGGLSAWKLR